MKNWVAEGVASEVNDTNPHPLESLDRDDSELETRYGLKSENCVENTNYALKVWKSDEKSNFVCFIQGCVRWFNLGKNNPLQFVMKYYLWFSSLS